MSEVARAPWARDGLASAGDAHPLPEAPGRLSGRSAAALAIAAAVLASLWQAGVFDPDARLVNLRGLDQLRRFAAAALTPELAPDFLVLVWEATGITLAYAVLGTVLSLAIGIAGGLLSSEVWWRLLRPDTRGGRSGSTWRWPWHLARLTLAIPRAIHEVIWGLLLVNVIGLDPWSAILAIGLPYGAIVAKVYAEILDETPRDALRALETAGAPPLAALAYGIVPRALPDLVSYAFYRFECAIRAAAVLGIVGAGGLGYQLLLSTRSLQYEEMWTLIFALMLLSGGADLWSGALRRRLAPERATDIDDGCGCFVDSEGRLEVHAPRPGRLARISLAAVLVLAPWSWWLLGLDAGALVSDGTRQRFVEALTRSWPPRAPAGGVVELAVLSAETLAMSVLAMAGAAFVGFVLSFPAAAGRRSQGGGAAGSPKAAVAYTVRAILDGVSWLTARTVLLAMRAVPPPIWALVAIWLLYPGSLPGAVALAAYTAGILGRLMAEVIENADPRPSRALQALGAGAAGRVAYGLLPAILPRVASYVFYRWEVCIRTTVVVGLVGAGGLGQLFRHQVSSFDYRGLTATLICFLVLTLGVDAISARLRSVLR